MRKLFLLSCGGAALCLFACLVAPDEPSGTSSNDLHCATSERAFNGSCRKTCVATAECGANATCMKVSADLSLCLNYAHCAYLGSDTTCSGVRQPEYYDYGFQSYGESTDDGYGYSGAGGCAGNATWQVVTASGDPACGASHAVTRCAPIEGVCELVNGSTADVAEP